MSVSESERIRALEKKILELECRLNFDELTGVHTRQFLFEKFPEDGALGGYLIFLDLDDFKSVNDHYGHASGDELLKLIARAMTAVVGERGYVVRVAGDEFAVVLRPLPDAELAELEGDLRAAVQGAVLQVASLEVSRTASLGCVKIDGLNDAQEALAKADMALLRAKQAGKNRFVWFSRTELEVAPTLPSVDAVRQALRDGEIGYHVQPILECQTEEIMGFEALLRWSRPSGEVLGPHQFLRTMTAGYDAKTMPPLSSAARISQWAVHERSKYISFNISEAFVLKIAREGLGWVDDVLGGVPSGSVVFELLETVVAHRSKEVICAVEKLRERGVRVALDDFGIGFSNLERLQGLNVDFVKIDKSFVHAACTSTRGLEVFTSMIELSQRLGAQSVVEGVETQQQLDLARSAGASFAQGFFLGRPRPISDY